MVEVRGIFLEWDAMCMFSYGSEVIIVRPLWVSQELLICETRPHPPRVFSFELQYGGGAYATSSGLTFT
jgi:hypothetical protein